MTSLKYIQLVTKQLVTTTKYNEVRPSGPQGARYCLNRVLTKVLTDSNQNFIILIKGEEVFDNYKFLYTIWNKQMNQLGLSR